MRTENFLNELDDLMPDHPYKKRWLKELDGHLEDFEEDLHREGQTLSPLTLTKRMGAPKRILDDFYKTLHPWRTVYYLAEALFTGLLITFIGLGLFSLQMTISDSISSPTSGLNGLLALLITCIVWYLIHSFNWQQAYTLKKETGLSVLPWAFITLSPIFLVLSVWCWKLASFGESAWSDFL